MKEEKINNVMQCEVNRDTMYNNKIIQTEIENKTKTTTTTTYKVNDQLK